MYKKLLEVQKEIGAISKDSENPFFHSKYFDINKLLEVVKPVLSAHGLVLLQPLSNIEGKSTIKTILVEAETGETLSNETFLTENPDPQKMGSAITYYRRYSLQSLLGLQAEDDDANKASEKKPIERATVKKFKPETSIDICRKRIEKGFDMLNFSEEGKEKKTDEFLNGEVLYECKNITKLNQLLEALTTEAKGVKK